MLSLQHIIKPTGRRQGDKGMIVAKDSKGDLPPSRETWWTCGGPCQRVLWAHEACPSAEETGQVLSEELIGE